MWKKKLHKQQGCLQSRDDCQEKVIEVLGTFTRSGLSLELVHERATTQRSWTWTSNVFYLSRCFWFDAHWFKFLFSDERTFLHLLWKTRSQSLENEEAHNPKHLKSSVKFPKSVDFSSAVSSAGVGALCFIGSRVITAIYQDILEDFMLSSIAIFMEMLTSFSTHQLCHRLIASMPRCIEAALIQE